MTSLLAQGFDTVASFCVLEHIEDDHAVFAALCDIARSGTAHGPTHLISYVPAHRWAYGAMDRHDGHFRRYDRARLQALAGRHAPEATHRLRSFNFLGLWAWAVKGRLLPHAEVSRAEVQAFERIVPLWRPLDSLLTGRLRVPLGQSVISVLTFPGRTEAKR